jgi:hypothetical protein
MNKLFFLFFKKPNKGKEKKGSKFKQKTKHSKMQNKQWGALREQNMKPGT